ncbi:MAG: S41 family peptidase [Bacteroidales bacterium]|nr:S41 family peptidase [Bacteroidales bacterium]
MRRTIKLMLCIFISVSVVTTAYAQKNTKTDRGFELSKNLEIFSSVYKTLYNTYVDDINEGELMQTAIDAMLAKLDPYTNFYPESNMEDVKLQLLGEYGGIGALIHSQNGKTVISEPYEGMPAYEAGVRAGDIILEVNGQSAEGKTNENVRQQLRGQAGSDISLKVERNGRPMTFNFKRKSIALPNVPFSGVIYGNIGYIKLNEFTKNAADNVLAAFNNLKKSGVAGVILDLRGNGGGLLNEAVDIINIFVDKNTTVVTTKGKVDAKNQTFKTMRKAVDTNIPVVVLIDPASASASEIVSGSLQDLDRAVIMGQRSFGKGLVQNVLPLVYNTQMKVTVSKYYIPSGRCIQAIDYSHRDTNGRAVKIQDSLRTAYKTKNGRTVYDGYGIEPDIALEPQYASQISFALISKFLPFDYATEFVRKNPVIAPAKDFKITDSIYDDFVQFLKDKDYSYTTATEEGIKFLTESAKKEKCGQTVLQLLDEAKQQIDNDKQNDLYKFKDEIKDILLSEITVRYYNQKGRTEAMINADPEVKQAAELLKDKEKYLSVLKPESKK